MSALPASRPPRLHGLRLLPELFATPLAGGGLAPLGWRRHLAMALVLVPPVILTVILSYDRAPHVEVNPAAHGLLEGFCALMSLIVFYVLHQEYISTGTARLRLIALGFLALGLLDGAHAFAPPHSELFVWLRSAAALVSSALFAFALTCDRLCRPVDRAAVQRADARAALFGTATVAFALGSYALRDHLPSMLQGAHFSSFALVEKGFAGLLYLVTGLAFLRYYRRSRENILFVLAVAMFHFAESQWLAIFSDPWDVTWWIWHWVRTAVFVGILIGIADEFVQSARELQQSHHTLVETEKLASLGEMAASVAHEIRNPLGMLTGSIGLLRDPRLEPSERAELIDLLERETNRLNHIVSDTLAFAYPRPDRLHLLNLEAVVRDAVIQQALQHPRVSVDVVFEGGPHIVRGDEVLLQRIVWNLFENAAAAMGERGSFAVKGRREGDRVEVEFRDDGPGMAPEVLAQVLKPFFTTKEHGVGLGLPLVQRMVLEQDGRMDILSEPGKGTSVRISFPVVAR